MATHLELPLQVYSMDLDPTLTDEEFEQLCATNADVQLERDREGRIVVNPPAAGFTGTATAKSSIS
jgi:hypothetical protein